MEMTKTTEVKAPWLENYGDIPGYVKTELGLTDADIEKLRNLYTQ